MANIARPSPCTRAGAIQTLPRVFGLSHAYSEVSAAELTLASDCAQPCPARPNHNKNLIVPDFLGTSCVASTTRGHNILCGVVERVAVQVIRDDVASAVTALANTPFDQGVAPKTLVRSRANAVVQRRARLTHQARDPRQWMRRITARTTRQRYLFSSRIVGTAFSAKPPYLTWWLVIDRATSFTSIFHTLSL